MGGSSGGRVVKEVAFVNRRLTALTEQFKVADSTRKRRRILKEALPLCQSVEDVRMLFTYTFPGEREHKMVAKRWDEITRGEVRSVPQRVPWTNSLCHALYLKARYRSEPERTILSIWNGIRRSLN